MSLDRKRLIAAFIIALCAFLFTPTLAPSFRLIFFAPFLIIVIYQKNMLKSLWIALLCGIIVDLFSYRTRLGTYALNYSLTIAILYHQKRNFFADSISTLPLMTYFFGVISTVVQVILLYIFESPLPFSWRWVFIDLFLMPAADAAYAFVCFLFPRIVMSKPVRKAKDYFLR